jgi:hypothetical protein
MKKVISIAATISVIYLVFSMASGIVNMQSCAVGSEDKSNWTCEQVARTNSESCHYVILRWKKVSYGEELNKCLASTKTDSIQKLPEKFISDKEAFGDSLKKFGESSDITNSSNRDATQEETAKVLSLASESIEQSKKVNDEFLDYLHPELKSYYREKFIKGQQLYYEGLSQSKSDDTIESESVKKQIEGTSLVKEWLDWWGKNNGTILDKIFAE